MASKITLNAVDVDITISGGPTIVQGQDIVVSSVSVTNRVNDLSEASVSLGYKTKAGLEKLRKLFPIDGNEGVYYSELTITLKKGGPLSNLTRDYTLFKGFINGFGHSKQAGNIEFVLNARGGLFQLSQILLGAPGFHPSAPVSWGLAALRVDTGGGGKGAEDLVQSLLSACSKQPNPYEVFKCVILEVAKTWNPTALPRGILKDIVFAAAIKAYGLGANQTSVIEKELERVIVSNGLNNNLFDKLVVASITDITLTALASAQMFIWDYLLGVLDAYGLELITVSDKAIVTAKDPLNSPVTTNKVKAIDLGHINTHDLPFTSPTRCVISILDEVTANKRKSSSKDMAIFPEDLEPTTQEEKTGVKTIYLRLPAYFAYVNHQIAKPLLDQNKVKKNRISRKGKQAAKQNIAKQNKDVQKEKDDVKTVYPLLAKYFLMKAKFKQRTGMAVFRLNPELLPGFPAQIEDPLGIATFDCYIQEVTHTISYPGQSAQTSAAFNYIRYSGDLDPNPFPTPLYPSYDPEAASKQVLSLI